MRSKKQLFYTALKVYVSIMLLEHRGTIIFQINREKLINKVEILSRLNKCSEYSQNAKQISVWFWLVPVLHNE